MILKNIRPILPDLPELRLTEKELSDPVYMKAYVQEMQADLLMYIKLYNEAKKVCAMQLQKLIRGCMTAEEKITAIGLVNFLKWI